MITSLLLLVGLALSAFFSGSETGFYRVTRVRLVMDAKSGSWVARALLWMVTRTTLVVATVLIGNNVANYLVSFGLTLLSQQFLSGWGERIQMFFPVLVTPFLFVYGELLPKYLFYQMPYRLLRAGAPLMLFCTILFLPVSFVVLVLDWLWRKLFGRNQTVSSTTLERQELQRVLMEGQEAGVLLPIQREIAQNLFTFGVRPVRHFTVPLRAIATVAQGATREEMLAAAQRMKQNVVAVLGDSQQSLVGCYHITDLLLCTSNETPEMLPVLRAQAVDSNVQILTQLHHLHSPLAVVFDHSEKVLGVVTRTRLSDLLLSER
ncbi:MAG: DUF21 domain-containing protein [Planctomycetales bacterium]|nr:DUF21 domain-containing protein [Planctomycetales bacterium]